MYNFKKGDIGESLIRKYLLSKGYFLYDNSNEGPHPCDNIATKWDMNFRPLDIKTYPRRCYYADTGINYSHFLTYFEANKDIPFYIIFVDDISKKVYGNKLTNLLLKRKIYNISIWRV